MYSKPHTFILCSCSIHHGYMIFCNSIILSTFFGCCFSREVSFIHHEILLTWKHFVHNNKNNGLKCNNSVSINNVYERKKYTCKRIKKHLFVAPPFSFIFFFLTCLYIKLSFMYDVRTYIKEKVFRIILYFIALWPLWEY